MKPITLEPRTIHIRADRRLVFQVLTAYGNMGLDGYSSKVMEDHGDRKLVEFHTPLKIRNKTHAVRSVEWVQLTEPERIDFWLADEYEDKSIFALNLLEDAFALADRDGCTEMTYESRFAVKTPVIGWLLARLMMVPVMRRHMMDHLEDIKGLCEARAERSRVRQFEGCGHDWN